MKKAISKIFFERVTSQPRNLTKMNSKFWGWRDSWANVLYNHLVAYPNYLNSMYFWTFGFVGTLFFGIQLISGILLSMQYTAYSTISFDVVEHIMRDVNFGWLVRYLHANGASFFFFVIYLHIMRGLFFSSYSNSRGFLWLSGILIFILMMAIAFLGYILPWGQMSFWGATVITNLFSAIPFIGDSIAFWLWGGFSVDNATLVRFFSLHYLLPFVLFGLIIVHFFLLHIKGSTNPCGTDSTPDIVSLYPNFIYKDLLSILFFIILYLFFVFYDPNFLGHSDNYIPANPLVTPAHIVPEWYFLPFYAILRAIPNKLGGVLVMGGALVVLLLLPFLTTSYIRTTRFRPLQLILCFCFAFNFMLLGWLGGQPVTIIYILLGRFCAYFYFSVILIFLPLLWAFEALSTVYFKYELEDISRWINNHWELYSLRLVKSRWELFYSLFIFFTFFCVGCISFFFFFTFNVEKINKEWFKLYWRKFVFFWTPSVFRGIILFFMLWGNIVVARGRNENIVTILKNAFYRMKQKFCDCNSARMGNMSDLIVSQEKSENKVNESLLQIYFDFDLFLFAEVFFLLIFLIIVRRFDTGKLVLLFLQRKPLDSRFLDDNFFMKNTYKDLFLGCVSPRIYKDVLGGQDATADLFIGIFPFLKMITFVLSFCLFFSWAYLCCEHIGIYNGLISTHLHAAATLIGCFFMHIFIMLGELYFSFAEKRVSVDAVIGAVILMVALLFTMKFADVHLALLSLALLDICFFVVLGSLAPATSKAKLALVVAGNSFMLCLGFFLMLIPAAHIKYDLPPKYVERGVIVSKNVQSVVKDCIEKDFANNAAKVVANTSSPSVNVGKDVVGTFFENNNSMNASPLGGLNIYRLSEHLENLTSADSFMFFCGVLLILVTMFGNIFFATMLKDVISNMPFSMFGILGLIKLVLLFFFNIVAIQLRAIVSEDIFIFFQTSVITYSFFFITLAVLNANNIRYGLFCFMSSGGFFVLLSLLDGPVGQMLLICMYAVFFVVVVFLIGAVVTMNEKLAKRSIIYFSDLFSVMKEHSFRGIYIFSTYLLINLSFPLFFGFYYKMLAFFVAFKSATGFFFYFFSAFIVLTGLLQVVFLFFIFHFFHSIIMGRGVGFIFHEIRTDKKARENIYFFSYMSFIGMYIFFLIFFIMGAFYAEILVEVPRFGEALDMSRVIDLYPYVDTEVALRGNKSVVYVIEPLWWERTTLYKGHYTLDGALTEKENAELLRACTDCKKTILTLRKALGRAEFDNLVQQIGDKIIENKKVNK